LIASLRGILLSLGDKELVLEVGGVGLQLAVPLSVVERAPAIGQPMFLHTELIVREDSLRLVGFSTTEERETFDLLLQVSGIGPRLALAILSHLSLEALRGPWPQSAGALSQVPGIGRKTAEKIIFQLGSPPVTQIHVCRTGPA
jgi:Holliday junction DNA helicase RuvA